MKSFRIAFSGACHSGKTTFMQKLKSIMPEDVVISPEVILEENIKSIDDIRLDASKYLDFEIKIIRKKYYQDKNISNCIDKICLFDRSLIDSLFYLDHYLRKDSLTTENKMKFKEFRDKLELKIIWQLNSLYDKIIFFSPISSSNGGKFRPNELLKAQKVEYKGMSTLFEKYVKDKYLLVNFSATDPNYIPNFVKIIQEDEIQDALFTNYIEYQKLVEDKYLLFNHICSNNYGNNFEFLFNHIVNKLQKRNLNLNAVFVFICRFILLQIYV